jgi:hypothetical protein
MARHSTEPTEYETKQARLSVFLFELYHGPDTAASMHATDRANYSADAADVLDSMPHLFTMDELIRLGRWEPNLT